MFFAVEPIFYILASISIQYFPKQIEKRLIIMVASVVSFLGFTLVGPSVVMGLPDSLLLMTFG